VLKTIAVYILAIIVVAVFSAIGLLILFPFGKQLGKSKRSILVITAILTAFSNILAIYIFVWLCHKLTIQPTLPMFILPYILTIFSDLKRIKRAERGVRMAEISYQQTGEYHHGSNEFQVFLVRNEYGYFVADITGLTLGIVL